MELGPLWQLDGRFPDLLSHTQLGAREAKCRAGLLIVGIFAGKHLNNGQSRNSSLGCERLSHFFFLSHTDYSTATLELGGIFSSLEIH